MKHIDLQKHLRHQPQREEIKVKVTYSSCFSFMLTAKLRPSTNYLQKNVTIFHNISSLLAPHFQLCSQHLAIKIQKTAAMGE